jgi:hypothetical protein
LEDVGASKKIILKYFLKKCDEKLWTQVPVIHNMDPVNTVISRLQNSLSDSIIIIVLLLLLL